VYRDVHLLFNWHLPKGAENTNCNNDSLPRPSRTAIRSTVTSPQRTLRPRLVTWTQAAGWCAAITCTWLVVSTIWAWVDNRGQPWLGWALEFAISRPLVLLLGCLLAWRGRGWVRRLGWGWLTLVGTMMTEHVVRESLEAWWAGR